MNDETNKPKVIVIGTGNTGIVSKSMIEFFNKNHDIQIIGDKRIAWEKPEPYLITKLPELEKPWFDSNQPIFNHKKHEQSCSKNRKKRKSRK